MNNKKSYVGAPTTNHVPNADTMPGWTTYGGTPVAFQTEFGTTGYRMTNAPSWNGIYRGITIPSTGVYTFSVWARYLGGSPNNNGGGVYISGWGGTDSASVTNRTQVGQWQRLSITLNCTTTSMTFYLISYGGTNDGNSDRSSWEVTMPQAEAGSVATTFVAGTRSNTQALRDLTSRNVITANSLTYNANNTFSFNGSSNHITVATLPAMSTSNYTIEAIVYPTSFAASPIIICPQNAGIDQFIQFNTNGTFIFKMAAGSDTGERSYTSVDACVINRYSHIVCVKNGSNIALYKDGSLTASSSSDTLASAGWGSTTWVIGQRGNSTFFFPGEIPIVKGYDRSLSASEIFSNFTASRLRYGI
jgi:hypothetical protein